MVLKRQLKQNLELKRNLCCIGIFQFWWNVEQHITTRYTQIQARQVGILRDFVDRSLFICWFPRFIQLLLNVRTCFKWFHHLQHLTLTKCRLPLVDSRSPVCSASWIASYFVRELNRWNNIRFSWWTCNNMVSSPSISSRTRFHLSGIPFFFPPFTTQRRVDEQVCVGLPTLELKQSVQRCGLSNGRIGFGRIFVWQFFQLTVIAIASSY